jgi:hypothetical protein
MVFVFVILLWLNLVEFYLGLMILGVLLVILLADGFSEFQTFFAKTKFAHLQKILTPLFVMIIIASLVVPSIFAMRQEVSSTITYDDVSAFIWLRDNADSADVVLAPVEMGHYITSIAGTKNVIDTYFVLHEDAEERYTDVERAYQSVLETEIVGIFDKYSASFVLVPMGTHFARSECFIEVFDSTIRVFRKDPRCHLRAV